MPDYKFLTLLTFCTALPFTAFAEGQGVPINYDALSFFEEPLAFEVGPATLSSNILIDQSANYNFNSNKDTYNTRASGNFLLEMQLPNSWSVAAQYFARYDRLADNNERDEYTDNLALSVSDEWGTLAVGNVTSSAFEKARRTRGFGNADLANDNFLGALDQTGAFYSVRYNSYEASITADQEGRAEAALSFERPIGKHVYFGSVRVRKGDTTESASTSDQGDALGAAIVAKQTYANLQISGQVGYEEVEINNSKDDNDHVFGSVGILYKYGAYRFSADGGLGRYDGEDKRAFALGSRIDIARGASLNLGLNYQYDNKTDTEDTTGITSIRYEF